MRTTSYTLLFTLAPALLALLSPLVVSHPLQTTTQPGLVGPWRKTVPARSLHSPMPGPTADTARPGHWEGDELSRRLKSEESGGDQRIKPLLPRDKYSSLSPLSSSRETAGVSASGETSQGSFTVRQTRQVSLRGSGGSLRGRCRRIKVNSCVNMFVNGMLKYVCRIPSGDRGRPLCLVRPSPYG